MMERTRRRMALLIVFALGATAATMSSAQTIGGLALRDLDGRTVSPEGPVTMLFWRPDCGPCLRELSDLTALRLAARPGKLMAVGLPGGGDFRPALRKLKLADRDSLVASGDPAALLTTLGGAPPRLPLAVAFNRAGRLCGRRTGYLGRNQVRAWAKTCASGHAAG